LDIGCGQGRLPIGILRRLGSLNYLGLDIDKNSIQWCKKYIQNKNASFLFKHLNIHNERYNNEGVKIDNNFKFELESGSFDIVYLYSVFSHTTEHDMKIYLKEISRILNTTGKLFFTTFVENNIPNFTINPKDHRLTISGPLHVVQYEKNYLFSILKDYGFTVQNFSHKTEADGQSAIYLKK
jgi:SAM-dependent methyltransferase